MKPRVSVITATYNRGHLLPGAIRSVLGQTLSDLEHIIVDDGSGDGTGDVVDSLSGDPRIRYERTPHRGAPAALNLGLKLAKAPLVAFLDSDDEYKPEHLALLSGELRAGDFDFLLGRFEIITPDDEPNPEVADFYRPGHLISVHEIECITGVLFGKRDVFLEVGGFRDLRFADTDLFQRLRWAGYRWKRLETPTYRYYFDRAGDSLAARESADATAERSGEQPRAESSR